MIRKNEILEADIEKLAGEHGLTHVEGMAVFVRGALPGERVRFRVEKAERSFAFAKTLEVLKASGERREPVCPAYEKCGGCQLQHMSYSLGLEMKREHVRDVQKRLGGMDLPVPEVIGMADPWHCRNKIALPVGGTPQDPLIGYYRPRSHQIIPVDTCPMVMKPGEKVIPAIKKWIREEGIRPYNEADGSGLLRHIMIRVSRKGDVMAVPVVTGGIGNPDRLIRILREEVPGLRTVCLNVNRRQDNVILGPETHVLFGDGMLDDELCGLRFRVSPVSFFQVNPVQTEKLYSTALEFADLNGSESVCDLYCGAGTISLMLARKAKNVVGIEEVAPAVEDAKRNAENNGIDNASFIAGKAEEVLPRMASEGFKADCVVLDPPRKGCERSVLEAVAKTGTRRVVYVACDPATQARDIRILTELGYRGEKTQSVDMFCFTAHIESVVKLTRAGS
ncbi:MAG: 23S rRNA (uracil(1939)-C(5))-methyltransferase RlmD [Clostridia bacterium]|nr:23S rRNA (uracil(1939)-C(5))-methyltransferase RlmD [Clostridia bacterium]